MAIFLVQHGKAHSKELDPNRNLNSDGITDSLSIATTLKKRQVKVREIFHSGKARALETATIFAQELCIDDEPKQIDGIAPNDSVTTFAKALIHDSNAMFVGHLPFMEKLVSYLVLGDEDHTIVKFQNSGVVCLDKLAGQEHWLVEWMIVPSFCV